MSWKKLTQCLLIFLLPLCHNVNAYQEDGHFYTVQTVLNNFETSSPLTKDEIALIAFCTQLPDEVPELDAISVYQKLAFKFPFDYALWVLPAKVRRKFWGEWPRYNSCYTV